MKKINYICTLHCLWCWIHHEMLSSMSDSHMESLTWALEVNISVWRSFITMQFVFVLHGGLKRVFLLSKWPISMVVKTLNTPIRNILNLWKWLLLLMISCLWALLCDGERHIIWHPMINNVWRQVCVHMCHRMATIHKVTPVSMARRWWQL